MKKWLGFIALFVVVLISIVMWHRETAVAANESSTIFLPITRNNYDTTLAPIFGVQVYGSTLPNSTYHESLIDTNATWMRNRVHWRNVEPVNVNPPAYNWASADANFAVARGDMGGINIIGTIEFAPAWAAEAENGPIYPAALPDFAQFVGALVERYDGDGIDDAPGSPVINYWEFYNEPDNNSDITSPYYAEPMHWGNHGAQYAQMLATIYPVVKAANPKAQVVLGGLALDWFESEGGPFVESFLQDVLQAGGGNYFDVVNFHSYPAYNYRWTADQGPGLYGKTQYVHQLLASYGLQKPVVVTEAGWMSNNSPGTPIPGSPEIQSRYVVQLFAESLAAGIDVTIWWLLYDPSFPYPFMNGLVTEGPLPQPKMSFYVYQRMVEQLGTAHFVRSLTPTEKGHSLMQAYLLTDNVHKKNIYVAWLNPVNTTATAPLRLVAPHATVRNSLTGQVITVMDANDGVIDGRVTITVGADPLYIEVGQ